MAAINSYLYDLLGVDPDASEEDIKKAFRRKSFHLHPDKGGDAAEFNKVSFAYKVLINKDSRERYDFQGMFEGQDPDDLKKHVAISRMMTLMTQVVSQNYKDSGKLLTLNVINSVVDVARDAYVKCQARVREMQTAIENVNLMRSKCVYKGVGANVFLIVLDEQIKSMKQELEQHKSEMEVAKQIIDILSQYDYNV